MAADPAAGHARLPKGAVVPARRYPGLRPEAQLLLCVAGPMADSLRQARLRALIQEDLDWDFLVAAGLHNDVLPLVYWHLNRACPDQVPASVLGPLQTFFSHTCARNLMLTQQLVRLVGLLQGEGIAAIPFKGPALAQSLYGNVALRRAIDLDILIRKDDIARARQSLVAAGYAPVSEMSEAEQTAHIDSHYHFEFHRQEGQVHVEVHWRLLPKHCGALDIGYLWESATESRLAGQPTLVLPPEELFVLLCIHHGAKHEWDRLKWIGDIGWMIDAHRTMDWSHVLRRARALEHERAVLLGCSVAWSLLAVELPAEILEVVRRDRSLASRAALVRGRVFREGHGLPGFREWSAYFNAFSQPDDTAAEASGKAGYLRYLSAVVTPEFADRYGMRFPFYLSFLHYVYRPIRLLRRHGTGLFVERLH